MKFKYIDKENALVAFPALWEEFEQRFNLHLIVHDHLRVFNMPDGSKLLPEHNIHSQPCCNYKQGKRQRCHKHCGQGVIKEGEKRRVPFRFQCWRGIVECVVPVFEGKELAATFFAGLFRDENFKLEKFSKQYREIYLELPIWDDEKGEEIAFYLTIFANALLRIANNLRAEYIEPEGGRRKQIKSFIAENISNQICLEDLAAELDLSSSRVSHIIKEMFDCNFSTLVHREQVQVAKRMLVETVMPLKEIAKQCGFRNEFYFNRIFKQYSKIPPGKFRSKNLQKV